MSFRKYRGGHYPGHLRDMFLEAIDAFRDWNEGESEPTVEYENNYQISQIPISRACGLLWNCTDIVGSGDLYALELCGIELKAGRTYAAAARAMLEAIKDR